MSRYISGTRSSARKRDDMHDSARAGDHFVALTQMVIGQNKSKAIAAGGRLSGGVQTTTMHFRASQILGMWETEESIVWVIDCLPAPVEQVRNDETQRLARRILLQDCAPARDIVLSPDPVAVSSSAAAAG